MNYENLTQKDGDDETSEKRSHRVTIVKQPASMLDKLLKFGWIVLVFLWLADIAGCNPRDSTDPATGPRSQLNLRIDAATGCEYLAGALGFGLIARNDGAGKQRGCRIPTPTGPAVPQQ